MSNDLFNQYQERVNLEESYLNAINKFVFEIIKETPFDDEERTLMAIFLLDRLGNQMDRFLAAFKISLTEAFSEDDLALYLRLLQTTPGRNLLSVSEKISMKAMELSEEVGEAISEAVFGGLEVE